MKAVMTAYRASLYRKSISAVAMLESGLPKIILGWVCFVAVAGILRTSFAVSPINSGASLFQTVMPYVLLGLSPVAAYWIADQLFPRGILMQQPEIRLSRIGKWRSVDVLAARAHPMFGPTGMMASLLIGMLLNVPVRSLEFLAAIPAMNGNAPLWGQVLFAVTTFDVVVMNFLYILCFMAALRCAPWFPRFLVLVWGIDISAQLAMAHIVSGTAGLPIGVGEALGNLLQGNMQKVMISMTIWLPYLILSERVNLTYRGRVALEPAR
ncbi:DUF2569 domain-containing protein [Sphingorhabdus sp.]|uniref:DUF2569 domain-containing protein n=1 Tax=Sphingorhabdus sp. TaxID=1902408 RepID=UPI00391D14B7